MREKGRMKRVLKNTLAILLVSLMLFGVFSFVWNTPAYADCPITSRNSGIECSTYNDCPWNYPACSTVCTGYNYGCLASCCGSCAFCGSNYACWVLCLGIYCPVCGWGCCTRWEKCCIRAGYSIEPTGIYPK